MQTPPSNNWTTNQAETVSAPSRLDAVIQTRRTHIMLEQTLKTGTVALPGGVGLTTAMGQVLYLDDYTVEGFVFPLDGVSVEADTPIDCVLWSYNASTNALDTLIASAQGLTPATDFADTDITYAITWDYLLDSEATEIAIEAGYYAVLLLPTTTGTLTGHYAVDDRYTYGDRITAATRSAGSVMTEYADQDMAFQVVGHYPSAPEIRRWKVSNCAEIANAIEAELSHKFDPSSTTLPLDSGSVTMHNATYAVNATEAANDYDFTLLAQRTAIRYPGFVDIALGFDYDSGSFEMLPMTRLSLTGAELSEDDLTVKFSGESFAHVLDEHTFYGGRYSAGGITAATLFAEILDDAAFAYEGKWNYRLGESTCKASAAGTRPLWSRTGYEYYHVDPLLTQKVYIPIPPVSHRDALTMLAAYSGAYILKRADGTLDILSTLGSQLDYHLDSGRVYGRPKTTSGIQVGEVVGTLQTYNKEDNTSTILETDLTAEDTNTAEFTITHDACDSGSLSLTGATLVGTPTYNTYSTTFVATPAATTFHAVLTGYRVTIGQQTIEKEYEPDRGSRLEYRNAIASEVAPTLAMFDRYQQIQAATQYRFSMRDDPAIQMGDRVLLNTLETPTGVPVVITEITRHFNGGLDGDYVAIADPY